MKDDDEANNVNSEVSAVIGSLLDTLNDKDDTVQLSAIESLKKMSQKTPVLVIHAGVYFWDLHKEIPENHLIAVLKIMTDVCKNHITSLNDILATCVADLALAELAGPAREQASELLVALSKSQLSQAIGALILKFTPNLVPHHTIIRAIGMIAEKHSLGMHPFIPVTLSILIPLLPQINDDQSKLAVTFTLGKISDALNDCLMNAKLVADTGLNKDNFFEELSNAFEILTFSWLRTSRSLTLTENILISIASILPLLPKAYNEKLIVKLIPVLLNHCKKSNVRLASSRVLSLILNAATNDVKEVLRPHLEQIHQVLSDIVSILPFEATRDELLTHYEVLQCFRAIVILYPEEGLDRILLQLKSQNVTQRSRALVVLRHLINTLPQDDDAALQRIALSLQESLTNGSTRQLIGAIVALAARPTFPLLPSQRSSFIKFMVLHCGSRTDEGEACEEALHLLSSTVEGAESWLWPSLIKALLDETYESSVASILRALSPLAVKIIRDENNAENEKDFESIKVFGRCLELLEDERNRLAVVTFLRFAAPLLGHQLKVQWDTKLSELSKFLEQSSESMIEIERKLIWEERVVEFLEESVILEGEDWGIKLADELIAKTITPSLAIFIAALASNTEHITLLIELTRTQRANIGNGPTVAVAGEYARAVGICAKRHLDIVLKVMEDSCCVEDARKTPVKLLGLVRDAKAAATNEASKAGLLKAYAEIARKGNSEQLFPFLDKHTVPWIVKQLNECKELTAREAGYIALEQVAKAVHTNRLPDSKGFRARGNALATLLANFQSVTGHRPLQHYPLILKAIISLLKIPPPLSDEEKAVLLETTMDKVIAASLEIAGLKMSQVMQQIIEGLGTISSEVVADSADTLALLVEILLPWMQSKASSERRTTLLVLRTTLRSYYDSLKYTYPGGKLEPGKLLGRFLAWSADPDLTLRPLVVDCVALALNIGARHRSSQPDNNLNHDLSESKRIIVSEDPKLLYKGVQNLATAASERVSSGEVASLAEGLVEGLLYRGEGGSAAGIALSELFKIRGYDIPRANLYIVDNIISQMRLMENASCKIGAAKAVRCLGTHHAQEIVDHLLHQPLPLDSGTKECWKEIGKSEDIGSHTLELLLTKLENESTVIDNSTPADNGKRPTATFSSLAAIVAIGQLLNSSKAEDLVNQQLAKLFTALLKYLSGWLYVDPPMSIISTKFGFVPNRETCKIIPHREVNAVLLKILGIIGSQDGSNLSEIAIFEIESDAEENLVATVHAVMQCLSKRCEVRSELGRNLAKMITSPLPAQRAVAIAFYAGLIGKAECDEIWLESIVNSLYEAKSDSSPLVRKLATVGLTKVACLDQSQVTEYFDTCLTALLDGLEEPSKAEGSADVVLESLRGLSMLLSVKTEKPISPRVVLALKPFVEKEDWEMRLAAICALRATARGWQRFVLSPDDDVTDHLLSCIPCLVIKLEDSNDAVATASREVLYDSAYLMQCKSLAHVINTYLKPQISLSLENFLRQLIDCLKTDLPQRALELRNAVVRGYSRSENAITRATSALILGLFGEPRPEDVQRMLQLLRDKENFVRARAARGLGLCYTL